MRHLCLKGYAGHLKLGAGALFCTLAFYRNDLGRSSRVEFFSHGPRAPGTLFPLALKPVKMSRTPQSLQNLYFQEPLYFVDPINNMTDGCFSPFKSVLFTAWMIDFFLSSADVIGLSDCSQTVL